MKSRLCIVAIFTAAAFTSISRAETRAFIDQNGRSLEGEFVSVNGDMVTIKRASDGQVFTVKASNFSLADQKYFASKGGVVPGIPSAVGPGTPKSAAPPPAPNTTANTAPMRIEVKIYPAKKQKSQGGYLDDKIQRISYRVDIRNGEQQRAFTGGKATIMAFAEDLQDRAESVVISKEEFDVNLTPLAAMSVDTKEVKLTFDNIGYKYGHKYSGYLLVIKGPDGKTVNVTASSPSIGKFAEDALKLSPEDVFDKNYKFVKKGYIRDS